VFVYTRKKKPWTNAGWSSNEKDIILRVNYDNMAPAMRADLVEVGRGRTKKTSDGKPFFKRTVPSPRL